MSDTISSFWAVGPIRYSRIQKSYCFERTRVILVIGVLLEDVYNLANEAVLLFIPLTIFAR